MTKNAKKAVALLKAAIRRYNKRKGILSLCVSIGFKYHGTEEKAFAESWKESDIA